MASKLPLIVIVGPTASGKTDLAIKLAQKCRGEIICADSRTVYKDMNIGTAKPDIEEQKAVPHWGIDIASPSQRYTVAEFQEYSKDKIIEIRERGNTPFLVGGTGLYIDSVAFDYQFPRPMNTAERARFESMSKEDLYNYCLNNNIELPIDSKNKRRLIRAIGNPNAIHLKNSKPDINTIIVGITTNKQLLLNRIHKRTEQMFEHGVVEEAMILGKKYGWEAEAMTSNIYTIIRKHLNNHLTLKEAKDQFMVRDWQLAKRQLTWFRRNPHIEWCTLTEAENYVLTRLAHEFNL